ncbi:MAG: EI24 domain-containing protein [Capsulimonadales bacterium]|nr:EI24 domain-containing protein [Capsulimonadales bacterium]
MRATEPGVRVSELRRTMDAFRGIFLVMRTPRLWKYCFGPVLLTLFVYMTLGILGGIFLLPHLAALLSGLPGSGWLTPLVSGAAIVLWLLLFPFLFTLFGGVFFGMVYESIAEATEREVRPERPTALPPEGGALFADVLGRLALNLTLGLTAFVLGLWLGPIPGVVAAGVIGLLDFTAPTCLRRGMTLGRQLPFLFRPPDARTLSFALVAGLLTLIPFVGVFLLPGLVAGGTLLVLDRERS